MQRMEQEIRELHQGLGAVVQALQFVQTFLESDYGLKFQFQAYCNSPSYSHNSGTLEILKQKYPRNTSLEENACYAGNPRLYQQDPASETDNTPLIHMRYPLQGTTQELEHEQVVMNTVASSCSDLNHRNFASNNDHSADKIHQLQTSPVEVSSVSDELNDSHRSPIMVNEDELFGISDLATMKVESHEMYQPNDPEMDTFGQQELDDEDNSSDEMVSVPILSPVAKKKPEDTNKISNSKKRKAKREKLVEGYKCPHCRRRCPDKIKLDLHMTHHKQQFQCSECGIWLADKSVLNRHMRTHTGDRPFKCAFCKESFSRQDIVKKHMQRKHKGMIPNDTNKLKNVEPAK